MRVVCDNCGASYKIPESKLTKEVNKATCRKCGHAIYIRKTAPAPAAAASPVGAEERTLITSSADLAARSRGGGFDEMAPRRAANPASQEATLPRAEAQGYSADSGHTIVPPDPPRSPPTLSPAPNHSFAPAPPLEDAPPRLDRPTLATRPPPEPRHAPEPPRPAARQERSEPIRPAPSPAAEREPPRMPTMAPAAHDPRGDLTFAMLASLLGVFGVLVLLVAPFTGGFASYVSGAGAFFALLGAFATVFVLMTGGRGTRAASLAISVVGGFLFAAVGAGAAVLSGTLIPDLLTPGSTSTATPPVAVVTPPAPEPAAAPPPVEAPPAAEPPPPVEATPAVAAVTEPPPAPEPVKADPPKSEPKSTTTSTKSTGSTSRSSSTPSSSSSSSSSTSERITPSASTSSSSPTTSSTSTSSTTKTATSSTPATTTSSSSSSTAAATSVSPTVIDTMMRSNKSVKNCFITEKNESGSLPTGVRVKFTIQPSGKVSSASIPSGDYKETAFDSCLSGAVKSISFPPFEGDAVTLTYPFRL